MALAHSDLAHQTSPETPTPRSRWVGARMSLEEFLALPEGETSLEFDDGLVTQKMAPQADHSSLQSDLWDRMTQIGRAQRSGRAFTEKRFVTPGWSPVPDVSFYAKARLKPASRRRFGKLDLPPDIAVEIVSPDQSLGEMLRKCVRYADLGIPISLVVDPNDETVYDIRPGEPLQVLQGEDPIDLAPVLPDFGVTVQGLFSSIVDDWLLEDDEPAADVQAAGAEPPAAPEA